MLCCVSCLRMLHKKKSLRCREKGVAEEKAIGNIRIVVYIGQQYIYIYRKLHLLLSLSLLLMLETEYKSSLTFVSRILALERVTRDTLLLSTVACSSMIAGAAFAPMKTLSLCGGVRLPYQSSSSNTTV